MDNYKDMYYQLFNKITDIIEELKQMQISTEEMCIEREDKSEN